MKTIERPQAPPAVDRVDDGRFGIVPLAALHALAGKPAAVHVFAVLCAHAGPSGIAFPSVEKLASITGLQERTVQRQLGILVDRGVVTVDRRGGGKSRTTRYRVQRVTPATPLERGAPPETVTPETPLRAGTRRETVTSEARNGDTGRHQRVTPATPQQVIEQVVEQKPPPTPPVRSRPQAPVTADRGAARSLGLRSAVGSIDGAPDDETPRARPVGHVREQSDHARNAYITLNAMPAAPDRTLWARNPSAMSRAEAVFRSAAEAGRMPPVPEIVAAARGAKVTDPAAWLAERLGVPAP